MQAMQGSTWRGFVVGVAVCLAPAAGPVRADIDRFGGIGDSLTDEHLEPNTQDISYARCWTELLVDQRGIDMGPTAEEAGQEGGTWGEPRRTGYEHNWARYGATSEEMLSAGQHTGLADAVVNDAVTHAVMFIGANDFGPGRGYYQRFYYEQWDAEQIEAWIDGRVANMRTALETVVPTGVNLVLVNIWDWGVTPSIDRLFGDPARQELAAAVISRANDRIEELSREFGLPLVDFYALTKAIFGENHNQNDVLLLGNVEIALRERDDPDGGNPATAWVHDRIHPNTVIQGIEANVMMTALRLGYGEDLQLFTEEEILDHAGLHYGGEDTLAEQIGDYADYVLIPCAWDLDDSGAVDFGDVLAVLASWGPYEPCPPVIAEDIDQDCEVAFGDLLAVLANWGPCPE